MKVSVADIPADELDFQAIRASGPGGQHVNKVSSAIHLRFDVATSSLPEEVKSGLFGLRDSRMSNDGVLVIKAQRFRSQEKNREDALSRLGSLLQNAQRRQKPRKKTKPSKTAVRRRLDTKNKQGQKKGMRGRVREWD